MCSTRSASLWSVSPDVETTLEANPTSIEAENFRGYRAAGVNRVSVGVQALNDEDLKALGRQHSAEEALAAFRLAAKIFPRVSFDMIYARPGQTPAQWRDELTRALAEQQGHMSLYQLTIEPGTAYFDLHERGSPGDADRRPRRRSLRPHAGADREGGASRPTKSRTTPRPARSRGTTCSTGAMANMRASAPARTAGWRTARTAAR